MTDLIQNIDTTLRRPTDNGVAPTIQIVTMKDGSTLVVSWHRGDPIPLGATHSSGARYDPPAGFKLHDETVNRLVVALVSAADARADAERTAQAAKPVAEQVQGAIEGGYPIRIEYRDGENATTIRTISPTLIEGQLPWNQLVRAYDHYRDAPRTFRLDRIQSIVN